MAVDHRDVSTQRQYNLKKTSNFKFVQYLLRTAHICKRSIELLQIALKSTTNISIGLVVIDHPSFRWLTKIKIPSNL